MKSGIQFPFFQNKNTQQVAERSEDDRFSPPRFLVTTMGAIFLAEVIAMITLLRFSTYPYYVQTLIDASLMVLLISPVIYVLSFRPLLQHMAKRRYAEQQAREMALFAAWNPDAVLQVDADGQIVKANPAALRMELIVGAQLPELVPDLLEIDFPACIRAGLTQQVHQTQLGERTLQWVIHGAPELGLAFLYSTDITEQMRAQTEIRRLSSIVEQIADTVVVTDREGRIEYVNPAFENQVGYRRDEVMGRTPSVLKSGLHDQSFYKELWDTILKGEVYQKEIANRSKNGRLFYEFKTITPLRDTSGDITHFVATGKDITDRIAAEEKLQEAFDALELRVRERTTELAEANASLMQEIHERQKIQSALEQSELELRASEEKAQNLVKFAPAAIYEMDFLGEHFLSVNDTACEWTGYTREEMLCMSPLSLVDEASKSKFQEHIQAKLAGDNIEEAVEYRVLAKDGHTIIAEMHVGAFTYKAGRPESVLVVAHDITSRKQAEEEVRQSREDMRRAQEVGQIGSWRLDVRQNILRWSEENHHIFGIAPGTPLTYETFLGSVHPDDREYVDTQWQAGLTGAPYDIEHRIIVDGQVKWVREKAYLEFDESGRLLGGFGITQDITNIKKAEQALRTAHAELERRVEERTAELAVANEELRNEVAERRDVERQLRVQSAAMEAAASGILITDPQGTILWTNPALSQMSGYRAEELLGQSTRLFRSGDHDRSFYHSMWRTILAGNVWKGETTNRRKDGSLYIEGQTITPVRGEHGEISHFIAIKEDITEKKAVEQEIRARNEKERMLTHTIHTLQLDIARDLHDTLGQNISYLRMKLDYLNGRKIRKQTDLQAEIRNMAQAANESYDLLRGTLAMLQSSDSQDLYHLLARYTGQIEERAGFKIEFSSQGEPRPISAPRMRQLFYIFREILNNIEKHAQASRVNIEILWVADHMELVVRDDGQGFDMNRVQFAGHYGLRFMRERIELLNGSLDLCSGKDSGTKISVLIPYETS